MAARYRPMTTVGGWASWWARAAAAWLLATAWSGYPRARGAGRPPRGNTRRDRARCRARHGHGAGAAHRAAAPVPSGVGPQKARRQRTGWPTGHGGPRAGGPGRGDAGPG